jgi:hypothetical protein
VGALVIGAEVKITGCKVLEHTAQQAAAGHKVWALTWKARAEKIIKKKTIDDYGFLFRKIICQKT